MSSGLSTKHQKVLDLHIQDPEGKIAPAYKAVYKCTAASAHTKGCILSKTPKYAKALKEALGRVSDKSEASAVKMINFWNKIIDDYDAKDPKSILVESMDEGNIVKKTYENVKLSEALKASELIGKHKQMFPNKHDVDFKNPFTVVIDSKDADLL